jgi:hypothetical protein
MILIYSLWKILIETVEIGAGLTWKRVKRQDNELISPFRESSDSPVVNENKALAFLLYWISTNPKMSVLKSNFAAGKNGVA